MPLKPIKPPKSPKPLKPEKNLADGLSTHEVFRETYHAGFTHALDAVLEGLKGIAFSDPFCPVTPAQVVEKVRQQQAAVQASVAIAKASAG